MKQRKGGCKKSSPKSSKKKYLNASSVIEMSYIMPLFLFLFVIIIHTERQERQRQWEHRKNGKRGAAMTWNLFSESV